MVGMSFKFSFQISQTQTLLLSKARTTTVTFKSYYYEIPYSFKKGVGFCPYSCYKFLTLLLLRSRVFILQYPSLG